MPILREILERLIVRLCPTTQPGNTGRLMSKGLVAERQ